MDNPVHRLIVLAGRALQYDHRYTGELKTKTRLSAYADVAAYVLDACPAPVQFEIAITAVLAEMPVPAARGRAKAAELRREWAARFVPEVMRRLSPDRPVSQQ